MCLYVWFSVSVTRFFPTPRALFPTPTTAFPTPGALKTFKFVLLDKWSSTFFCSEKIIDVLNDLLPHLQVLKKIIDG